MRLTSLTTENIGIVFADLSDTSLGDAEACGLTVEEMKDGFLAAVGTPFSFCFYDGDLQPACLVRMEPVEGIARGGRLYFVDKREVFTRIAIGFTIFVRRMTDDMVRIHDASLELLTRSEQAGRWFELMGFWFDSQDGGLLKYVKRNGR